MRHNIDAFSNAIWHQNIKGPQQEKITTVLMIKILKIRNKNR